MSANEEIIKRFLKSVAVKGERRTMLESYLKAYEDFKSVTVRPYPFTLPAGLSWEEENALWDKEFKKIEDNVIQFSVGDGYASYRVASFEPLVLEHIDFWDGYRVSNATLNGLTPDYVRDMLDGAKRMREMFSRK